MKISIIIPVYNTEKYIKRCIKSIKNQTYRNIEIIIINDGSNDLSMEKIKEIQDNRITIINKKNTGVSDTRNIGIKKATGDYIMFVDADDYLEKTAIERIVEIISDTSADIVKFNYNTIKGEKRLKEENYASEFLDTEKTEKFIENVLKGKINGFVWSLAIKTELTENIKFNTEIGMMEDLLFFINILLKASNIYIINDRLYNYCINEESVSNSSSYYYRNFIDMLKVCELIIDLLKRNNYYNDERKNMVVLSKMLGIESIFYKVCIHKKVKHKMLDDMLKNTELNKFIIQNINLKEIEIQRRINIKLIKKKNKIMLILFNKIRYKLSKIRNRRKCNEKSSNNYNK